MINTILVYGALFLGNTYQVFGTVSLLESIMTAMSGLFMFWFYYYCKEQQKEEEAFIQWLDTNLDGIDCSICHEKIL